MLARLPIREKIQLGTTVLLVVVAILAISGFRGIYAYRRLAKNLSQRAAELPLTTRLVEHASAMREAAEGARRLVENAAYGPDSIAPDVMRQAFDQHLFGIQEVFQSYKHQVANNLVFDDTFGDRDHQLQSIRDFQSNLERVMRTRDRVHWLLEDPELMSLEREVADLHARAKQLPSHLHVRMQNLSESVRTQYRTWIVFMWFATSVAIVLLLVSARWFYRWVFAPLRVLIHGSRRVAAGEFEHVIDLNSHDEMAELAQAMNGMTRRFCEIRDDLDRQVRQRTREVIRSEQLASVGFLAAGVAHEINNPLASIALCAESLEDRLHDVFQEDAAKPDDEKNAEVDVLRHYLRMIQDEAFRCKQITEGLLDFSRLGDVQRQPTELVELVQGVIDMIGHLGKYKEKEIHFQGQGPLVAYANAQEVKQVVLNLITNGLESLDPGGTVTIELHAESDEAVMVVRDNGCGMTQEVLEHIFEPFFTRRRDGHGTGLGMSISYRIIAGHGGSIDVFSEGPGRGSTFTVRLPLYHEQQANAPLEQAA